MISSIIPKDRSYQCGTRIYWNTSENAYFEVFTKQKHVCPNRSSPNNKKSLITELSSVNSNKPNYYNNKFSKQPKPKMSNSDLLTGPFADIQRKYELLSDIVTEYSGKVHGSQSHILPNNTIQLIVYFEVLEGKRDEVKQKFNIITKNQLIL
jgi:hypothetical protein